MLYLYISILSCRSADNESIHTSITFLKILRVYMIILFCESQVNFISVSCVVVQLWCQMDQLPLEYLSLFLKYLANFKNSLYQICNYVDNMPMFLVAYRVMSAFILFLCQLLLLLLFLQLLPFFSQFLLYLTSLLSRSIPILLSVQLLEMSHCVSLILNNKI